MQEIQNTTMVILRNAMFADDPATALAAVWQATANVEAMAVLTGKLQAPPVPRTPARPQAPLQMK